MTRWQSTPKPTALAAGCFGSPKPAPKPVSDHPPPCSVNAMMCGGSPSTINHPSRTASIRAASASESSRREALAICPSNRYGSGWSAETRPSSAQNVRVRESACGGPFALS